MAWAQDYNYRVKIPIGTVGAAQTNYCVFLTVNSGTGTNAAGTIYCQNNALNFPNDIRITTSDGNTLCDYYRIPQSTASSAMLWVELPNISNSGNTDYYLYYGNASGTDVSSGPNTFAFFDDFELGNLSRWATAQSGWSASTTYKNTGSYGGMCYGTVTSGQRMMETPGISGAAGQAYLVHCAKWDSNATASSDGNFYWGLPTATWSSATHTFYMGADGYSANRYYTGAAWAGWPTAVSISNSTWYFCELVLDIPNQLFRFFHDTSSPVSTSKGTATAKDNGNTTVSTSASFNTVQVYETGNSTSYRGALDEYWVRKYYYTEPGWATPGSLEQRNSPRWMHYHKMRAQQN